MDLALNDEQQQIVDSAVAFLDQSSTLAQGAVPAGGWGSATQLALTPCRVGIKGLRGGRDMCPDGNEW